MLTVRPTYEWSAVGGSGTAACSGTKWRGHGHERGSAAGRGGGHSQRDCPKSKRAFPHEIGEGAPAAYALVIGDQNIGAAPPFKCAAPSRLLQNVRWNCAQVRGKGKRVLPELGRSTATSLDLTKCLFVLPLFLVRPVPWRLSPACPTFLLLVEFLRKFLPMSSHVDRRRDYALPLSRRCVRRGHSKSGRTRSEGKRKRSSSEPPRPGFRRRRIGGTRNKRRCVTRKAP